MLNIDKLKIHWLEPFKILMKNAVIDDDFDSDDDICYSINEDVIDGLIDYCFFYNPSTYHLNISIDLWDRISYMYNDELMPTPFMDASIRKLVKTLFNDFFNFKIDTIN